MDEKIEKALERLDIWWERLKNNDLPLLCEPDRLAIATIREDMERLWSANLDIESRYRLLTAIYEKAEATLARWKPLIEAAGKWDASKLAHLTTASLKDKCSTCDEAMTMVLELADILTDIEFPPALACRTDDDVPKARQLRTSAEDSQAAERRREEKNG